MHALFTVVGMDVPHERVRSYWRVHRHELKETWATNHPASDDHVPFALYGDSAKIHDDGTKMCGIYISLPAVWRPHSSRCSRWCVFALEDHKMYRHITLHLVFQRLVWSCNLLFHGHYPEDPTRRLCGGRVFCVTELKGDWQWHKNAMRFRSTWQSLKAVCFLCNANGRSSDPGMLYYCLDESPSWKFYNLTEFLADQMTLTGPCFLNNLKFSTCGLRGVVYILTYSYRVGYLSLPFCHPSVAEAHIFFFMASIQKFFSPALCTRSTWGCCMMWTVVAWYFAAYVK